MCLLALSTCSKKYSKHKFENSEKKVFDVTAIRLNPKKPEIVKEYLCKMVGHCMLYKRGSPAVQQQPVAGSRQNPACMDVL